MYVLVNTFGACVVRIFGLLECFWTRLRDEEVGCLFGVICDEVWGCEEVLVENVLQAVLVVLVQSALGALCSVTHSSGVLLVPVAERRYWKTCDIDSTMVLTGIRPVILL